MANTKFQTQEDSKQNTRFLNAKDHTPPEPKANQTKRQTQSKTPTPPKVENTRFYQMSLDKPQDKPRLLNRHNKKNVDHQDSSSQSRGRSIQLKVTSILEMNTMME
jgi:hypothetical protein